MTYTLHRVICDGMELTTEAEIITKGSDTTRFSAYSVKFRYHRGHFLF